MFCDDDYERLLSINKEFHAMRRDTSGGVKTKRP